MGPPLHTWVPAGFLPLYFSQEKCGLVLPPSQPSPRLPLSLSATSSFLSALLGNMDPSRLWALIYPILYPQPSGQLPLWQHTASLHTPCTTEGGRRKEMQAQAPASSTSNHRSHKTQEAAGRLLEKPKHLLKMLKKAGFADMKGRMAEVFLSVSTVFAETICKRGVKKGGQIRCSPSAACYNDASPADSVAFR